MLFDFRMLSVSGRGPDACCIGAGPDESAVFQNSILNLAISPSPNPTTSLPVTQVGNKNKKNINKRHELTTHDTLQRRYEALAFCLFACTFVIGRLCLLQLCFLLVGSSVCLFVCLLVFVCVCRFACTFASFRSAPSRSLTTRFIAKGFVSHWLVVL